MEEFASALGVMANVFAFAVFLALINERIIELLLKPVLEKIDRMIFVPYVAMLTGLVISVVFQVDLITPLAEAVGLQPLTPWAGYIVTGLLVGGGSNFLHDLWPSK